MLPHSLMDSLIEATVDVVEEAILNAITAAETMTGYNNRIAYELPLDKLARMLV